MSVRPFIFRISSAAAIKERAEEGGGVFTIGE